MISIHALREEGDAIEAVVNHFIIISIHALREEGDRWTMALCPLLNYFYPRPPRGGRPCTVCQNRRRAYFYPRPPRGGRHPAQICQPPKTNFYPRPPRGGRRQMATCQCYCKGISIHALREEGDDRPHNCKRYVDISIHALREEGDKRASSKSWRIVNFYPRPPRGGRQQKQRQNLYFLINYTTFCTNLEEP